MKIRRRFLATFTPVLIVLAAGGAARADDIDIYTSGDVPPQSEPMVMFSLDYRPNLAAKVCQGGECDFLIDEGYLPATGPYTFFDLLRAVLKKVMDPLKGVKVGLMLNHDNVNNCQGKVQAKCANGGYMARGFELFLEDDDNGAKQEFHDILASIPLPQGVQSHTYQGKELFFEFYRYLTGGGVYNARVGFTDYYSDPATNLDVDGPGYDWDPAIMDASQSLYFTPITAGSACAKIFTVNIMFQVSSQEDDSDAEIRKSVALGGMALNRSTFPDVIGWLHDADLGDGQHGTAPALEGVQNVTSYFIVDPTKINVTTAKYAQAGGTGAPLPLSEDPEELINTFNDIFKQILSVSTTFVAASIPVNVFNRAEIVDNVYVALFQADEDAKPVWPGNVKKLKVAGLVESNPRLVDANDNLAIATDGRIRYDALTFWTNPATLPPPDPDAGELAGRDGRTVARGGSGQQITGFVSGGPGLINAAGARKLFFDDGNSLAPLNADEGTANRLKPALGALEDAEAFALLRYARGQDVDDLDGDGDTSEARPWVMGDPLHSRPLPLNFGARGGYSESNQAIYVAVGSNDGYLRLLRNTTTGGAESGEEVWAFMPQSVMGKLKLLRTNPAGIKHPYLVDGAPVAYLEDTNSNGTIDSGEKAWLFFGMRRGGRNMYALDITDPENPELLWTIEKDGEFAELGYTFSDPRVINVSDGTLFGSRPALAFGGGYDLNKDLRGAVGTDDSEGRAVFIVDAETGKLIWKAVGGAGTSSGDTFYHADLRDSIPSAMAILDSDGDGRHDRLYVGDTGGNVWRADIQGANTGAWKLTRLAQLGRHAPGTAGIPDDRRFFHRPDVVQSFDALGGFDAVVIGSGTRPDPLDKGGFVTNWAYMIKDRNFKAGTGQDTTISHGVLGDITSTCLVEGGSCTADLTDGWRLELLSLGEKSLASPLTIANTVYMTTYIPPHGSEEGKCAPAEGGGRFYAVNLKSGFAVNDYDTTTEGDDRYTELDSKGIPAEVVSLPPTYVIRPDLKIERTGATTRFQTYWFEAEDGDL